MSREHIGRCFDKGKAIGATYMIMCVDTFDYSDYPVFVHENEDLNKKIDDHDKENMQRVLEVYDLRLDKSMQLNEVHAWHVK
jgi:hypothetical protein